MEITFEERVKGRLALKNARIEKKVPCVCYGNSEENTLNWVSEKNINTVIESEEVLFDIGGVLKDSKVVLQEVQRCPLTHKILHVDFRFVDILQEIEHEVILEHTGQAPASKKGGVVDIVLSLLLVKGLPRDIPHSIEIPLHMLEEIGDRITVADLTLPEGIVVLKEAESVVALVAEEQPEEVEEVEEEEVESKEVEEEDKKEEAPTETA